MACETAPALGSQPVVSQMKSSSTATVIRIWKYFNELIEKHIYLNGLSSPVK